jgi:hypothetical protein
MSQDQEIVDLHFGRPHWDFWTPTERYVDFEGAARAGKTTPAILRVIDSCQTHPGIQWLIARWTQDATDAQLEARFRELCSPDIPVGWNAQEQYFEIATEQGPTSRIYARGLKASEDAARYSKFAGLTLAGIYVDQPEEMPEDFFPALQAQLSQPGYPHQLLLTPNPPNEESRSSTAPSGSPTCWRCSLRGTPPASRSRRTAWRRRPWTSCGSTASWSRPCRPPTGSTGVTWRSRPSPATCAA